MTIKTKTYNDVKGKSVVVTGGAGFIGSNLVFTLVNSGANVVVIDLPTSDFSHLPKQAKIRKVDILSSQELSGLFSGVDIVYHLAAKADMDGRNLEYYDVNFKGTENIIREINKTNLKKKPRFVFYSTQLVVGLFNQTRFIDEEEQFRTKSIYGKSKILAEKIVKKKCKKYNIPYVIIRPTSVYGPRGKEPYRNFFLQIYRRHYFHIGKANNLVSLCFVDNLVDLTILLSLNKNSENNTFFANDFHPYTMRELSNEVGKYFGFTIPTIPYGITWIIAYLMGILKVFGALVPLYPFRLYNLTSNYCYSIEKSINMGYRPQYNLKSGIKKTLDWYAKNDPLFSSK